ncbi:MAG TPA: 23S rRNA (uracil(1939)-C(5))-methyltransferase RlmD [Candidatus Binatia bacterium]|nr:23S rRNA (uracil(1939)-C(5))-methyltransferase RlmD [Candidatus Binatia bacterium]
MADPSRFRASPQRVELEVTALAYEGAAVARQDGRVVFVDGGAPGDRVLAEILRQRTNLAEARVVEVLRPGPARVRPPCPVADRCGGCDWQHVEYGAQLEAKAQIVRDALERNAKILDPDVSPVSPSAATLGYRNRIRLHVNERRLCYYERRTRRAVVVTDCLIAEDGIRAVLPSVAALVRSLATSVREVEIAVRGELPGVVLSLACGGRLHGTDVRRVLGAIADPSIGIAGVTMFGARWHRVWGDMRRRLVAGAPAVAIDMIDTAFGQVNTAANRALVQRVLDCAALSGSERVWDLYAGAGNLSLPLARSAGQVVAVERDVAAVAAARAAACEHGIGNIDFHAVEVEDYVAREMELPDLLVLNPPRTGVGDHARRIAELRAPRVIYVSCNPPTLARDAAVFVALGYRMHRAHPIDLFPQTCRVETVCELLLT